jgi:hypothetical protein
MKDDAASRPRSLTITNFILQGQPRKQSLINKTESALMLKESDPDDPDSFSKSLKPVLMEAIQDMLDELDTVYESIGRSAKDHIHSECVIAELAGAMVNLYDQRNNPDFRHVENSRNVSQASCTLSQVHSHCRRNGAFVCTVLQLTTDN